MNTTAGIWLAIGHIDEGLAESRRAVELDPLSPEINTALGFNLYFARRYDEAIKQLRTTIAIDPDYWWAHEWLGRAYARVGRFSEAIAEMRTAHSWTGIRKSSRRSGVSMPTQGTESKRPRCSTICANGCAMSSSPLLSWRRYT